MIETVYNICSHVSMLHNDTSEDTELNPGEDLDDEEATLADDVLDEVGDKEDDDSDFSTPETDEPDTTSNTDKEEDEEEDDEALNTTLEADAEEVDFDSFDDLDEM